MTMKRLQFAKRVFLFLLIFTMSTVVLLRLLDVVSSRTVLMVFLAVELPSLLVVGAMTAVQIFQLKTSRNLRGRKLWDVVEEEQPFLRLAIMEARTLLGLITWIRGRKNGMDGMATTSVGFDYAKGTMSIPIAMGIATIIEAAAIHVLIPWMWLRVLLLVVSVYGLVLLTGMMAARVINPHVLSSQNLTLKWGHNTVLTTSVANIASIQRASTHRFTEPTIEGPLLALTSLTSTNVRIILHEAVPAAPPVSKKHRPRNYTTNELALYVAEPDEFVRCVAQAQTAHMKKEGSHG